MKNYQNILVAAAIFLTSCITDTENPVGDSQPATENTQVAPEALTTMEWTESKKDLGSIKEGQKLEIIFKFKNTGKRPLTIAAAQPSCGCTVPEKPEKPIMPGEEGQIKAVFDSQGRAGTNHKTITVTANTEPSTSHVLEFDVNVIGATPVAKS